jgi:hypothetical protein
MARTITQKTKGKAKKRPKDAYKPTGTKEPYNSSQAKFQHKPKYQLQKCSYKNQPIT